PSNVSTRVKQLERELGVALFRKQGRTLALSAEGRVLLSYVQRLFQLADEAESQLRSGQPAVLSSAPMRNTPAGSRLAPVLSRFHRAYPSVEVELATGTTGALLDRVANFELEAAFVSEPFNARGFETIRVFDEELVLITARTVARVKQPGELAGATMLAFAAGCSYRRKLEEWLGAAGIAPARTLELASYQAMIACVAAGTGFAAVPRSLLLALRAARDVAQHELPARIRRSGTHLVWKGEPSSVLGRFREVLGQAG
ncbi:MAG: LysR substrate-binding domain-containing protein, partial [Burkholderiales bacterium]